MRASSAELKNTPRILLKFQDEYHFYLFSSLVHLLATIETL